MKSDDLKALQRYLEQNSLPAGQCSVPELTHNKELCPKITIVIPCYLEPDLLKTLHSLDECTPLRGRVLIIVVHNSGENEPDEVKQKIRTTYDSAVAFNSISGLVIHNILCTELPQKHAGVGLARKIGMDAAAGIALKCNNPGMPIMCLDADCRVEKNYLTALETAFEEHPDMPGCSIYFEHPVAGDDYSREVFSAIVQYELHLRYYIAACRMSGHPHVFQTVGSSMAVRATRYARQGGMNRRQAGEDFYFLHKFTQLPGFSDLTTTAVYPSPRQSARVPFGTGKAVGTMLNDGQIDYMTYDLQCFRDLQQFFTLLGNGFEANNRAMNDMYNQLPESVTTFVDFRELSKETERARRHSASRENYMKALWQKYTPFFIMKYLHHASDRFYPRKPVAAMAGVLAKELFPEKSAQATTPQALLSAYRQWDRQTGLQGQ